MATESYPPVLTEIAFISGVLLHLVQAVAPRRALHTISYHSRGRAGNTRHENSCIIVGMQSSYTGGLSTADSDYRVNETRQFARMLGLKSKNTAVRSPVSNGIAESFMKTIKRDYISIMPKLVVCFLWSSLCSVLRKKIF